MNSFDIGELHWLMDTVQSIDVGLVVLDRDYQIQVWNGFMENHSGLCAPQVQGQPLFTLFPGLPEAWFRRKADSVFMLRNRAFTTWEQRPYLFQFRNYRPITGQAEFMYQNTTLMPLISPDGSVEHICIIIYDVTDVAVSKLELSKANAELARLSRTDRLTGLNNRGYWEECLEAEYRRYQRTLAGVTLIMFDIDHFKRINDTYGHQAGDEVIRTLSRTLQATMRETDIAGRYGGEEFAVILIDTDASHARCFAERLRHAVDALCVNYDGREIRFTISLGLAELQPEVTTHTAWIELSDQALYHSKENGRNRLTDITEIL